VGAVLAGARAGSDTGPVRSAGSSDASGSTARAGAGGSLVPMREWVELVGGCQQLINMLAGVQTVALAHVAAVEDVLHEDGTLGEEFRGLGHQSLDAPALVQDQLGLTCSGATDRVATAVDVVTRHPQVLEAMTAGRLDAYRAGIVVEELADAESDVCHEVVAGLREHLGTEPGGMLRRRTRRVLATVDAELVRRKSERARGERSLRRTAFASGVDEWSAKLPVEESRVAWSVVDQLAPSYMAAGQCSGIEQARADAFLDLIHARATGQVSVQLTVPATELAAHSVDGCTDRGDWPGEDLVPVTGFGMAGVTHVRATWLASVAGSPAVVPKSSARVSTTAADDGRASAVASRGEESTGTESTGTESTGAESTGTGSNVQVVACNDSTGALVSLPVPVAQAPAGRRRDRRSMQTKAGRPRGSRVGWSGSGVGSRGTSADAGRSGAPPGSYRPPPWMVEFVKARDGRCRFPGCTISARLCDVDHVIAWPVGITDPVNLACLCRRHHRTKQRPGWRVRLELDGTMVWTDPIGRERTTTPVDHLQIEWADTGVIRRGPGVAGHEDAESLTGGSPLPSALEEHLELLCDAHAVDLACRVENLSAYNRKALRAGRRVSTSPIASQLAERRRHGVDAAHTRGEVWFVASSTRPGRDGHRTARARQPSDDPPPF
jgi:hypothetical protein